MYYKTLKVALFGVDEGVAGALGAVEAPPRFTIEFEAADAASATIVQASSVVIANAGTLENGSIAQLSAATHEGYGFHELVLVATPDEEAQLTDEELASIDAIWPRPLTPSRAAFEFKNLLARAKQHADLYITGTYLDTLIDSMPEMVWFKANDGEHVKVNTYFCGIVDKTRDDVEGQFHNYIWSVPPEDWEKAELTCKESDDKAVAAGTTVRCEENVSTHGEIRLFDTYKTPIFDEDGSTLGTTGFAHDITVERELEELAWKNARTDYLTGLYNRRYFYEYLEEHESEGPMTFVLVDLDNFKDVNDLDGHDAGDNALLVTTSALEKHFPDCPVVRWGGDEFIVIVRKKDEPLTGDDNMNGMQKTLAEWTKEQCGVALTSSIGIAEQLAGESVDSSVKHADDALYEAKVNGKAQHARYRG